MYIYYFFSYYIVSVLCSPHPTSASERKDRVSAMKRSRIRPYSCFSNGVVFLIKEACKKLIELVGGHFSAEMLCTMVCAWKQGEARRVELLPAM